MYEYGLTNSWQDWNGSFSRVAQTSSTFCSEEPDSLLTMCILGVARCDYETFVGVGQEYIRCNMHLNLYINVCVCVCVCVWYQ